MNCPVAKLIHTCRPADFSFYGNKIFQSTFIKILSPGASLFTTLCWTLLNSGIALIGYWAAACVIDNRYMGRLRLQLLGFFWVAVLFYVSAIWCAIFAHLQNVTQIAWPV